MLRFMSFILVVVWNVDVKILGRTGWSLSVENLLNGLLACGLNLIKTTFKIWSLSLVPKKTSKAVFPVLDLVPMSPLSNCSLKVSGLGRPPTGLYTLSS
jgi:hypothetical protein